MARSVEDDDARKNDPAASMSLLQALLYDPLNYGFSAVEKPKKGPRKPRDIVITLILSTVLAFGSTIAAKNLISLQSVTDKAKQSLQEQVTRQQKVVDTLRVENDEMSASIAKLSSLERRDTVSREPARKLAETDEIHGRGVTVTVTEVDGADAQSRILDTDLRVIINALWSAGAEGISLNGERIGPTTAVRTAGRSILVNFKPTQAPYELKVIGDAESLEHALKTDTTGNYLSTLKSKYGIDFSVKPEEDVVLRPADNRIPQSVTVIPQEKS